MVIGPDILIIIFMALVIVALLVALLMTTRRARPENTALNSVASGIEARLAQMSQDSHALTAELTRTLNDRLDKVSTSLGKSVETSAEKSAKSIGDLQARLAVIDKAQKNIIELSQEMVGLQDILSNKQARGKFGEWRLNDLVMDALPRSAYEFQHKLGNGRIVDCIIRLPGPPGLIPIDSKFPLESYRALVEASDDTARTAAGRQFKTDVLRHVGDISERYVIPGETADSALMFLPSEAVYIELQNQFPDVVSQSHRKRVAIVSPTTLWATLHTIRSILRDAEMRQQAHLIQREVMLLAKDVERLGDRVGKLRTHFTQANKDIDSIEVSAGKIASRSAKIEDVQLDAEEKNVTLIGGDTRLIAE